jgi:rod shape-determining protein MreB
MTGSIFRAFSSDLAIDLGTANTLVFERNKGIVLNEPSVVALRKDSGELEAAGAEAKEMLGRTPERITAVKPMKDGVVADFKATAHMLNYFMHKVRGRRRLGRPRIVIGVASEITPVECRAVREVCAKANQVHLVQQPILAAAGAGLPIDEATGNMIVDIGGGTTDVAVISLAGVVYSHSVRIAGNAMDEKIIEHCRRKHNLLIGERTAEAVKIEIGSAYPVGYEMRMEVRGRDLSRGVPTTVTVNDTEIREALSSSVNAIIQAIKTTLERTPPELSADISDRGLVLAGGGGMLKNLDLRISKETGLSVSIAPEPLTSVVLGAGKMLNDLKLLRRVSMN